MKTKIVFILLACTGALSAKENVGSHHAATAPNHLKSITAGCAASTAKTELAFNNVRTTICINGDMWWDPMAQIGPQYEIPKGSLRNSLFSGALWMGGIDASNNLKVAAQTYRQDGSDFWPGPVDTTSGSINPDACLYFDRHWKITLDEIKAFVEFTVDANSHPEYGGDIEHAPEAIKTWPGNGDPYNGTHNLAPYYDANLDGRYDYHDGDYPNHNQLYATTQTGDNFIYGDQCIWWVFNDVGNIHTETGGASIGLEIQAQAFAFATNDEINNMTFYNYKIINRSSTVVNDNYFGVFVDADLGYYLDDYVGCDVPRGLGYCYNGDADDEGPTGYGVNPPSIGIDFFRGPLADLNDSVDNNRNCIIDEPGEQIIMSRFVYYNNDFTNWGNPSNATHYYNYLRGIWKNGQGMTYGGDGHGTGSGATTVPCKFMFPGDTDHQWEWGTGGDCFTNTPGATQANWNEYIAGNQPADRRFLHSAGPFTLGPGALNIITTGAVWARATQGGPQASVNLLRIVDDKAQALFDSHFSILNGPDAPDVTLRELDKEIILCISNAPSSNNYKESYRERDPYIDQSQDTMYAFQGYQLYQLKDQTVSSAELDNPDRARLVAQVDTKDTIGQIVNHYLDFATSTWKSVEEVNGENKGIRHTFRILTDKFATGDNRLINHKNYFFMAIAYGFNNAEVAADPYAPTQDGQRQPYIPGRRNVKVYTAIPHNTAPENYGQQLNSLYGYGPKLTRIEGSGDGYLIDFNTPNSHSTEYATIRLTLDITSASLAQILDANLGYKCKYPEYEGGRGPVDVKVIDPFKVPKADFILWLDSTKDNASWHLKNITTGDAITAEAKYSTVYEQIFSQWGISVTLAKIAGPLLAFDNSGVGHGFVEATMSFSDPNKPWLIGAPDQDAASNEIDSAFNWIHSPDTVSNPPNSGNHANIDGDQKYEKVLSGIWAPFCLTSPWPHGPSYSTVAKQNLRLNLNNIDVVITRDKSKWSRCVVVENNFSTSLAQGGAKKDDLRKARSIDIDGNYQPDTVSYFDPKPPADTTWGKFSVGDTIFKKGNLSMITIIGSIFIYNSDSTVIINDNTGSLGVGDTIANHRDTAIVTFATKGGMSWFPGYAVDVEKGERLNIFFSEDSWRAGENGKDMKWNPTSHFVSDLGEVLLGGFHYIYIVNSNKDDTLGVQMTRYDECSQVKKLLLSGSATDKSRVYKNVTWVNFPMLQEGYSFVDGNGMVPPCDVEIRLRVARPYSNYGTGAPVDSMHLQHGHTYVVDDGKIKYDSLNYGPGMTFTVDTPSSAPDSFDIITVGSPKPTAVVLESGGNNGYPMYTFNTNDFAAETNNVEVAKDALDLINVVPNPYYAYSAYEGTLSAGVTVQPQLDNRVKIVNLPPKCTVSIYTVNGILVRKFDRDVASDNSGGTFIDGKNKNFETSLDWDLKNHKNVPIASGLYLIHVEAKDKSGIVIGERTLKWFGVMRPIDLDAF